MRHNFLTGKAVLLLLLFSSFFELSQPLETTSTLMFSQFQALNAIPNDAFGTIFDSILDPQHSHDQSAQVAPPSAPKKHTLPTQPIPPPHPPLPQPPHTIPPIQSPGHNRTASPFHFKPAQPYRPPASQKVTPEKKPQPEVKPPPPPPPPPPAEKPAPQNSHIITIWLMILMLGVYLFWKAVHYWWALLPAPALSRSLIQLDSAYYSFYRELCFFLSVVGVLLLFSALLSKEAGRSLRELSFAFTHFVLLWFLGGFLVLIVAEIKARQWLKYESLVVRSQDWAERIQKQYELLYLERKEAELLPFVEYLVMRQEFITPSYLPMLRESFHRSDFNFADYLVRSLADTLAHFFSLRVLTLGLCFVLFLIAHFITKLFSSAGHALATVLFLVTVLIVTQLSFIHLTRVLSKLVPAIAHPSYVNLQLELDAIDPFQHYSRLLRPEYLGGENDDERQSESAIESSRSDLPRFGRQQDNPRLSPAWDSAQPRLTHIKVGGTTKPTTHCKCIHSNRHQSLFCCGRLGIQIIFSVQQLLFLSSILSVNYFLFSKGEGGSLHDLKLSEIGTIVLAILLFVLLILFLLLQMPSWAIRFTLCTSLQMMKKRHIESEVVKEQSLRAGQRNVRIYQTFKLIRRELLLEQKQPSHQVKLRRITRRLAYEVFSLYQRAAGRNHSQLVSSSPFIIDAQECEQFSKVCGNRITRREQFVFLKSTQSRTAVSFTDALEYIEANMNDAAISVNQILLQTFALYFNDPHPPANLALQDLYGFFQEYQTYFESDDISEFLEEIKLTMRSKSHGPAPLLSLTSQEIAVRMRNEIERFPR